MIHHWTLQQLRLFEAVSRHKSFTRAAEELHLTQPAVSIQIKRLEDSIGLPLFEQVGKKIFLTSAGEEVYATANQVVALLKNLSRTVIDMKGKVAGPLKVAVVTTAEFFMPYFLGHFLRQYSEVHPQLTVTNRVRILERLANNQDDFVVMGQVPKHLDLVVRPFMENVLVPVAYPEHPLTGLKNITLEQFAKERFLMRESGSGTRSATERLFAGQGLSIEPYMELGSSEAIKYGIMGRLGVSVLPQSSLALELEARRLIILPVEGFPLRRMWHAVYLTGKRLGLTASTFLEFLVEKGANQFYPHLHQLLENQETVVAPAE
jgi:LysR family transcriptional regulator, low CO2-responsive transcriptional regulator